jgi:hypothetical protein
MGDEMGAAYSPHGINKTFIRISDGKPEVKRPLVSP